MTIGILEISLITLLQTIFFFGWSFFNFKKGKERKKLYSKLQTDVFYQVKDLRNETAHLLEERNMTDYKENDKTLEELVTDEGTEEDYREYIEKVIEITKELYKNYKFLKQDPQEGDYQSGYFMVLQFNQEEFPEEYGYLFKLAVDKSLDTKKINDLFVEELENGNVLPLGNVQIDPYNSGVSPILQATNVRVNITFGTEDYYEMKEKEEARRARELKERNEQAQEEAKKKDEAVKTIQTTTALLSQLTDDVAEKHELQDLVEQTKTMLGLI